MVSASVFSRLKFPSRIIVLAPKHHREGADWAVAPHRTWSLPGGDVESDPELAEYLAQKVTGLELDAAAHAEEHAIEVQLPLLARLAPSSRVVGIVLHGGDLLTLQRLADLVAQRRGVLRTDQHPLPVWLSYLDARD
jgi:AmmeMemoRadiSam system protein B